MRTTLTLEPDVAAALNRLRKRRKLKLKDAVNSALRAGIAHMDAPAKPLPARITVSVDHGRCLLPNLDNIAEVLAYAEGDDYK